MAEPDPARTQPPGPEPTGAYDPAGSAAQLVRVLDQYLADLQAGQIPDRAGLLAAHPEIAPQLEECLAGIEFIHRAARPGPEAAPQLGDFRVLREVGRGGMGVVYEAEQLSLRRRVALKVLRFGSASDPEVLERFRREAETVARLHHTNIVPIFAVGAEAGVHYYAMQFIEGKSLAAVLASGPGGEGLPRPAGVARWGLQAAEALAHAHQRGVIHRDIKPSNLLLDPEGVVWLTDFGLAKRADEVTLTLAGVLMGTPRYMSPEQAAAAQKPIDARTDIYSLGATLYELATGRPVFEAETPQAVVTQILHAEPVPPRTLRPALPRDLETIILKCLAKEPGRRYASAAALASDLRAFLEGRAIAARRPSAVERAWRWARKQRRSALLAGASAAAAALLAVGAVLGWGWYREARLGHLQLATQGPPLVAEVLDDADEPVVPAFTVPTQQPVPVPAGAYRLRVSGPETLSKTYEVRVAAGATESARIELGEERAWPQPLTVPQVFHVVSLDGPGADVVTVSREATEILVRRLKGATAQPVWEKRLNLAKESEVVKAEARAGGVAPAGPMTWWEIFYPTVSSSPAAMLLQPAPDLKHRGTRDLVWVSPGKAALVALSGKDGSLLWAFLTQPRMPERLKGAPYISFLGPGCGRVVGRPDVFVDDDGTTTIIAAFSALAGTTFGSYAPGAQHWVEAISGETGKSLWRVDLDTQRPMALPDPLWDDSMARPAQENSPEPARVVHVGGRAVVAVAEEGTLFGLDVRTGKEVWPAHKLPKPPLLCQFADVDGDGQDEALVLDPTGPSREQTLTALSLRTFQPLWQATVRNERTATMVGVRQFEVDWPVLADLDGDGKPEVILPSPTTVGETGLTVLDGATGQPRWQWTLPVQNAWGGSPQRVDRFVVGPDLDGDGCREVFVATSGLLQRYENRWCYFLVVEALSGKDGRPLWAWRWRRSGDSPKPDFGPLRWGQAGPDGWPELLVPFADLGWSAPSLFVLATGTGRLLNVLPGLDEPRTGGQLVPGVQVADLDGDGIPDLVGLECPRHDFSASYEGGKLHAYRGTPPVAWRRLRPWLPAQDLNGDGITDLVTPMAADSTVGALSGRDGREVWRSGPSGQATACFPAPAGDLDDDGTPDVLVFNQGYYEQGLVGRSHPPLRAVSGKTGRSLWEAADIRLSPGDIIAPLYLLDCRDLDGKGRPQVVFAYSRRSATATGGLSNALAQPWLAVLSGQDGKVRWKQPLGAPRPEEPMVQIGAAYADLDGDGVQDLITWGLGATTYEMRALGGRDGTPLWQRPISARVAIGGMTLPAPALGDVDGTGAPQVFLLDFVEGSQGQGSRPSAVEAQHWDLIALDARDGRQLWTWHGQPMRSLYASEPWPTPVLADLDGTGRPTVCVLDGEADRQQIVLLGSHGAVRARLKVPSASQQTHLRKGDLLGNGREELVCIAGGDYSTPTGLVHAPLRVLALHGGAGETLWEWPLPEGSGAITAIEPAAAGQPATVVVRVGRSSVYGLDGRTGKPRWRGEETGNPAPSLEPDPLLLAGGPGGRPLLVQHPRYEPGGDAAGTVCRIALPTRPDGQYAAPAGETRGYGPLPSGALPPVPSRWAGFGFSLPAAGILLFGLGLGLVLFWLACRNRWAAGLLAGPSLALVVVLFLAGLPYVASLFLLAMLLVPIFWLLRQVLRWARQGDAMP